jgi:probable O-glycosylation ligase (exosortase A-associated)
MEHIHGRAFSDIQPITSKNIFYILITALSIVFGVLNLIIPVHYLAAIIIISIAAIVLFLYPFIGLLVYQFITIIQPGVIFPSLAPLHVERLVAVFLIISLIINIKLRRDKLIITDHKLLYLMIFFILSMTMTVPASYWPAQSVENIIEFLKTFAFILLMINILKTRRRLRIFVWEYLILIGYMAVSSVVAYKTGNVVEAQGIIRAHGLAGTDPNTLSATLGLSLPFHLMLFRMEKQKYLKALSVFLVIVTIYTIVLTGSRAGFLGLGMVVLLSWWFLPRRLIRLFVLIAAGFAVIALMPSQYQERYASIFSKERDASSQERIEVWKKGIRMFYDHPFLGVGTGAFGTANAEAYSDARKSYLKAHNLYIQTAAELGILGLVSFLAYVGVLLYYIQKYRKYIVSKFRKRTWTWGVLKAIQISTLTLLVIGMFGHSLYRMNWFFYGALVIAVGFLLRNNRPREEAL